MGRKVQRSIGSWQCRWDTTALVVVVLVFGLVVIMVLAGYGAGAATTTVTATSVAAAELLRRVRETPPKPADAVEQRETV